MEKGGIKFQVGGFCMGAQTISLLVHLIRSHNGDPQAWIRAIFSESETLEYQQMQEISEAIAMCSIYDRTQTISSLRNAISRHEINTVAYQQVYGRSADKYQVWAAEQGRQFLYALIEELQP
jgi:hypothetical protein